MHGTQAVGEVLAREPSLRRLSACRKFESRHGIVGDRRCPQADVAGDRGRHRAPCHGAVGNRQIGSDKPAETVGIHVFAFGPQALGVLGVSCVEVGESSVVVAAGTVYTLSLTVKSALINWTNHWIVNDADETIVCSQEIRRELTDDFHSHSVIPVMGNGWKLFSQYGLDKCSVSSPDSGDTTLLVGYDMDSAEYVFTSKDNAGAEQRLRFAVKYRDEYGKRNGELKCDMTGYYQNKYGREKVQCVGIAYTVREERELN